MNNKAGLTFFVGLMIALVFIILALAFAPVLKQFTDIAMNDTTATTIGMNCSSTNLTNYETANCLFVDYQMPIFVIFLIFAAGAIITARLI